MKLSELLELLDGFDPECKIEIVDSHTGTEYYVNDLSESEDGDLIVLNIAH